MQSLLHERFLAIRWFNKNFPEDFDFYSRVAIHRKFEEFRGASLLQKIAPGMLKKISEMRYKNNCSAVFKGSADADKKVEIMRNYKFYLCYENTYGINGLISEKIFDCFAAGCIPIYLGAPDIKNYIPADCFIDREDFSSYAELHRHLTTMNFAEYAGYITRIQNFMSSEKTEPFTVSTFTKTIISHLDLNHDTTI
jgi:hypothetical protein